MKTTKIRIHISQLLLILVFLNGCEYRKNPITTSLPINIVQTAAHTISPKNTININTPPKTPSSQYQLTYTMPKFNSKVGGADYDYLYGIDIDCLSAESLCLGGSELILKTSYQLSDDFSKPRGLISSYSWSPDGKKIALCTPGVNNMDDIFVANTIDQKWQNITNSPIEECYPSWSPDGLSIIYSACSFDLYEGCRVFELPESGGQPVELLKNINQLHPQNPIWTPDQQKIIFQITDVDGHWQIYNANPDGSDLQQITSTNLDSINPSISSKTNVTVFESQIDQHQFDIYYMEMASTNNNKIAQDISGIQTNPTIAPFGNWIAFNSDKGISSGSNIFLVSIIDKKIIQITQGGGDFRHFARWRLLAKP